MMQQRLPFTLLSLVLVISIMASPVTPWCTTAGGVGDYSTKCPSSVGKWTVDSQRFGAAISIFLASDFEACFAMCQCYDANDNPTHEHQAICGLDECFCVFDACPYGR